MCSMRLESNGILPIGYEGGHVTPFRSSTRLLPSGAPRLGCPGSRYGSANFRRPSISAAPSRASPSVVRGTSAGASRRQERRPKLAVRSRKPRTGRCRRSSREALQLERPHSSLGSGGTLGSRRRRVTTSHFAPCAPDGKVPYRRQIAVFSSREKPPRVRGRVLCGWGHSTMASRSANAAANRLAPGSASVVERYDQKLWIGLS